VKKLKSLQEKIEENNKFIEVARKARNVNLSNESDVDAWDIFVRSKGEIDLTSQTFAYFIISVSPLDAFYQIWKKAVEERKFIRHKEDVSSLSYKARSRFLIVLLDFSLTKRACPESRSTPSKLQATDRLNSSRQMTTMILIWIF
jgi:hypothetical protein